MASAKKKKTSKKVAKKPAKKKSAPKTAKKAKAKPKAAAKKPKPAAAKKKAAPAKKAPAKKAAAPTHGDSWSNASLAPKVKAPKTTHVEPSGTPDLALHDHEGALVSPVEESEELAERIHGGEEAVKDDDADGDAGSPVLDDRDDDGDEE